MKRIIIFSICWCIHAVGFCQNADFSIPQRLNSSNTRIDILGKYPEGILILEHSHNTDFLETYYDDMTLHWRRPLVLKDKNVELEKVFIADDSVTVVYIDFIKDYTLLKISRLNNLMIESGHSITLDTLANNTTAALPIIRFATSADHKYFLIFSTADNFYDTHKVQYYLFDNVIKLVVKSNQKVAADLVEPTLIDAIIAPNRDVIFLLGEHAAHGQHDYNLDRLMVSTFKGGTGLSEIELLESKELYSRPAMSVDANRHRLIITGFYAANSGESGDGTFYYNLNVDSQIVVKRALDKFSPDFISMVTGNIPPKNGDSFDNFQVMDVVVKKDGGAILVSESQFETNESVANPMYGPFGIASSVTITYFHYDDIALFCYDSLGNLEWKKILHKRQETEGDAGYYSSYSMLISNQLYFIYNDNSSGQNNVSSYSIKPDAEMMRADIFNSDQKGISLIPKFGKQVSAHELVIPSVKRNYVQFVKFTF